MLGLWFEMTVNYRNLMWLNPQRPNLSVVGSHTLGIFCFEAKENERDKIQTSNIYKRQI